MYKFILILVFLAGCASVKDPYLLSNIVEIRELERQDHKACTTLKLNFDGKDNFLTKAYWHCRFSFAKYHLGAGMSSLPEQQKRDLEIRDLLNKIAVKIADTPEAVIVRENKKMDDRDHKKCLAMGFVFDTDDLTKIEDYYSCRKLLLDEMQLLPPYQNPEYSKYQNRSYGVGFVVDQRVSKTIARYKEMQEKYPTCVSFNINSLNFKRCVEAQDKGRQCANEIPHKKFRREGEEKVACQKRAYLRFSDNLMKNNDSKKRDIDRAKANADYYNNQSFTAIGIDESSFSKAENDGKKNKDESSKNHNSKDNLYEKFELTKLRQKFVTACQNDASKRVDQYVEDLKTSCLNIQKFEVIGDEQ